MDWLAGLDLGDAAEAVKVLMKYLVHMLTVLVRIVAMIGG